MTIVASDVQALEARHVLQTYRRQHVTFVRGQGVRLGFASVSPAVSSVVGLLNLEQFLSIFVTDDEALSSMENG